MESVSNRAPASLCWALLVSLRLDLVHPECSYKPVWAGDRAEWYGNALLTKALLRLDLSLDWIDNPRVTLMEMCRASSLYQAATP